MFFPTQSERPRLIETSGDVLSTLVPGMAPSRRGQNKSSDGTEPCTPRGRIDRSNAKGDQLHDSFGELALPSGEAG